jgi:DNA repair exonuclease SbcCD ATPase subunit
MKLVLNNFRCFKELTLELPENGTILLWGTSGIGKTTIFKAINFVLYGKEQKVVKHGEKKCKVEFHFNDIVVIRTKVPNHLTLKKSNGDEYSDEPAQKEIEKIFGRDFLLTSYMAQKGTESFFNLSNNEKSSFLQKLSLKDFDVESIRRKTREIIKERKDKLLVNSTKYKMIKKEHDSITIIKEPKLKIDLKGKSLDECIDSDNKLKDKVKKTLKEKRQELELLGNKLEKISINSVRIEEKEKLLKDLLLKLEEYTEEEDIEELKEELNLYNKCILYYTLKKSFKDIKSEYDKMFEDERRKLQEDIEKTKKNISQIELLSENDLSVISKLKNIYDKTKIKSLKDFESKLESIDISKKEETINSLTLSLSDKRESLSKKQVEYEALKKNIKELQDTIGNKGHSKYKCPKCSIPIYVEGECLKEIKENIDEIKITLKDLLGKKDTDEKTIKKLELEIKTINNDLVNIKVDYSNDIKKRDELQGYITTVKDCGSNYNDLSILKGMTDKDTENRYNLKTYQETLNKCLKNIELTVDVLPHYLKKKRDEVISLKKKYEEVKVELEDIEIESFDFYTSETEDLKRKIENYEERVKNKDKITKEKQKVENEIKDLKKGIEGNIDDLRGKINEIKEDIVKKEETEEKLRLREGKLIKYKEDFEKYKNQVDITNRLEEVKLEEEKLVRALGVSELMFKKINDAEGYSLQNTIDTINTDLEEFISHFFGDTFTVRLDSFKESKDGDKKSSIEVIIMQDGEQIPIDTLSGGEFDRLALALFLAFNKTSKSNIILLDECLASLHSELVEDIVELIKTKLSDKLVLFTLHQANTGIFDTIIDIEKYRCC